MEGGVKSRPLQAAGELERRGEETALRLQVAQRCLKTQGSQAPRLLPLTIHSVLCQRTRHPVNSRFLVGL